MTMRTQRRLLMAAALGWAGMPGWARAQPAFPSRPISLIVPYTAGGASDFGARLIAGELGKRLGQSVVVENVAGAGGALGVQRLVRAAPDGHTLLYGSLSEAVLVPLINPSVNYRSSELAPVALAGATPLCFAVRPDFPANTMDEWIALARRNPGKYTYGSPGIGTFQHVVAEIVKSRTGPFMVHIPYRGGQNILTDLLAGQIDLGATSVANAMPMLEMRRIKAIGVSSRNRVATLRDVPAFSESKELKDLDLQTWGMVFAPAATPEPILNRLNAAVNETLQVPAVREARLKAGSDLSRPLTVTEARAFYVGEQKTYGPIASRIKPE
jgi:tripartite-type tricarboxylate transporter receptor subunit TctC